VSVPQLRFPGFGGAWGKSKLSAIAEVYDGTHQTPIYQVSGVPFVSVENIGSLRSTKKYISPEAFQQDFKIKPKTGDIMMTRITAGIIGATAIVEDDSPLAYYVSLALIRCKAVADSKFVSQQIETPFFKSELHKRIIHVAFPKKINLSDLSDCTTSLPTLPEQKKIAAFLGVVDAKIAALRARVLGLQLYKRGLMQALFNQSLRFTRPDGTAFPDWKEKQLGDVAQKTASAVTAQSLEQDSGDYPVFGASGYIKGISFFTSDVPHIAIVKDGAGVGRLMFCPEKSSVLGTLDSIVAKNDVSTLFLFNLLSLVNFQPFVTGSTIPHIYFKDYSKLVFEIPHPEEQARIAAALSAMDAKIAAVQRQVGLMQNFKKGLLQQMFV
jgi:type I restriction enzyme, S subunit